jgi:cobalt-zinc-cadmium efflux system membrane fusion protein
MYSTIKTSILLLATTLFVTACNHTGHEEAAPDHDAHEQESASVHTHAVHLSTQQFKALNMHVDTLPMRNLSSYVEANGLLEAAPEDEAVVTAIIGANIANINVVEGEKVKKGQVLAYLSHPDLIKLQTDYVNSWNQLQYLDKEYHRQKRLYEEEVGSGMEFQQTQADYRSMQGTAKGLQGQLKLLGLDPAFILRGEIYERVPVRSPISG